MDQSMVQHRNSDELRLAIIHHAAGLNRAPRPSQVTYESVGMKSPEELRQTFTEYDLAGLRGDYTTISRCYTRLLGMELRIQDE